MKTTESRARSGARSNALRNRWVAGVRIAQNVCPNDGRVTGTPIANRPRITKRGVSPWRSRFVSRCGIEQRMERTGVACSRTTGDFDAARCCTSEHHAPEQLVPGWHGSFKGGVAVWDTRSRRRLTRSRWGPSGGNVMAGTDDGRAVRGGSKLYAKRNDSPSELDLAQAEPEIRTPPLGGRGEVRKQATR